jgi:protein LSM14
VSYGTETRAAEKFVPANPKVWPFIKFRGMDIRDLHVHKPAEPPEDEITFGSPSLEPPAQQAAALARPPQPPVAPVATWNQGPPPINPQAAARVATLAPARAAAPPAPLHAPVHQQQPPLQTAGKGGYPSNGKGGKGAGHPSGPPAHGGALLPGMGAALANRRVRGGTGGAGDDVSGEFDFAAFNAGFDKDAERAALQQGPSPAAPPAKKYDPTASFFDEISCDALERSKVARGSGATQVERAKNTETFGATSLQEARRRGGQGQGYHAGRGDRENQLPPQQGKGGYAHQGGKGESQGYQGGKGYPGGKGYQGSAPAVAAYGPPAAYGTHGQGHRPSGKGQQHYGYAAPSHQPALAAGVAPLPAAAPFRAPLPPPPPPPVVAAPPQAFHAPPPPPRTGAAQPGGKGHPAAPPGEFQPARRQRDRGNRGGAGTGAGAPPATGSKGGKGGKGKAQTR